MRSQRKRANCKHCGEPNTPDNPVSARGLHIECGVERMEERVRNGTIRDAAWWAKWREGVARSAGLQIPDGDR